MRNLVERVARGLLIADDGGNADAILAATDHAGDCPFVAMPAAFTCSKCQADHYRLMARAAIAAMREPSEAQREAARDVINDFQDPTVYWRAMIDEALVSERGAEE